MQKRTQHRGEGGKGTGLPEAAEVVSGDDPAPLPGPPGPFPGPAAPVLPLRLLWTRACLFRDWDERERPWDPWALLGTDDEPRFHGPRRHEAANIPSPHMTTDSCSLADALFDALLYWEMEFSRMGYFMLYSTKKAFSCIKFSDPSLENLWFNELENRH